MNIEKKLRPESAHGYTEEEQATITFVKETRLRLLTGDHADENFEAITLWAKQMEEKYPDAQAYELFHTLIASGSTGSTNKFDFPGEDSVLLFIKKLASS